MVQQGRQVGQVQLGQRAVVSVDSYPGRAFEGRVSMIFAVRIVVPNPAGALQPGRPMRG